MTVAGLACTDGLRTLVDLAPSLSDVVWEQAMASALRKRLVSMDALEGIVTRRSAGAMRAGRALGRRPARALPTESLLETLMVELARTVPGLPGPVRQLWVVPLARQAGPPQPRSSSATR